MVRRSSCCRRCAPLVRVLVVWVDTVSSPIPTVRVVLLQLRLGRMDAIRGESDRTEKQGHE